MGDKKSDSTDGYKKFVTVFLMFMFICCFRAYVLERVIISGDSMNPAYSDGDVIWVQKFDINTISRYQVVAANMNGKYMIKRVIGLPNETVQIIDGFVYINGEKLKDDYGCRTTIYGIASDKVVLGNNEYFLIGDNRDNSMDCRMWGAATDEMIKGVVVFRFFPFWKITAATKGELQNGTVCRLWQIQK